MWGGEVPAEEGWAEDAGGAPPDSLPPSPPRPPGFLPSEGFADQEKAEEGNELHQLPQPGLPMPVAQGESLGALLGMHAQHPEGGEDIVLGLDQVPWNGH